MSRAFVKDDDDRPEPELERPQSDAPNYVTKSGLAKLKSALKRATKAGNERDERYYRNRIADAIVVAAPDDVGTAALGATVTVRDARGKELTIRIVGEDEADPSHGIVAWNSPVARAIIGHCVGERVRVERPAGAIEYAIESISYEA